MRIKTFLSETELIRRVRGFYYKIEKLGEDVFLVEKLLDGTIISSYLTEFYFNEEKRCFHGFCSCMNFKERRIQENSACKLISKTEL